METKSPIPAPRHDSHAQRELRDSRAELELRDLRVEPELRDLYVEPWLRGPLNDVHPLVMPLFFSYAQVREDLARHTAPVEPDALWRSIGGSSLGFHLKHLAGSVDRLTTYLAGRELSPAQLATLGREHEPDLGLPELRALIDEELAKSEAELRRLDAAAMFEPRVVGRRALPTTVMGLLVHLAEHTQRHLGQAVTLAKLLAERP